MAKPKPWSHTALSDFISCPRQFYAKRVAKTHVEEEKSPHQIWGEYVHKQFEDYQNGDITELPPDLRSHQKYMDRLKNREGHHFCELKCGIGRVGKELKPTHFFADNVWWRGVIDYLKVNGDSALIVDYKTGKPHNKFDQLDLFAIHTFMMHPDVEHIRGEFYWTKIEDVTKKVYTREGAQQMWEPFLPHLSQYAQAFKTDTWPPRQSGLCTKWCPVIECEFNGKTNPHLYSKRRR